MYRFGQAAAAIGVTEAALRNWMTRNTIDLWDQRPEGGWRTFSLRDVFVLSLAAELVSYGAKVDDAVLAVQAILADTPEQEPIELGSWLYAVRTKFGQWELHRDEAFALDLAASRSVIKLSPLHIMADANNRLAEMKRAERAAK